MVDFDRKRRSETLPAAHKSHEPGGTNCIILEITVAFILFKLRLHASQLIR